MSPRLHTGCKAKVIKANKIEDNIGKVVILVKHIPAYNQVLFEGHYWNGGSNGCWVVRGENLFTLSAYGEKGRNSLTLIDVNHLDYVETPEQEIFSSC